MSNIDKIRQEIERRRDFFYERFLKKGIGCVEESRYDECVEILSFIDSLPDCTVCTKGNGRVKDEVFDTLAEQEPNKSLEEAAEEYRRESYRKSVLPNIDGPANEYCGNIKDAFIAGAEWQKEQMLKDAVEADVNTYIDLAAGKSWAEFVVRMPTKHLGDKVRIIVIKEDKK